MANGNVEGRSSLSNVMGKPEAWNYDERSGKILALFFNKYLILNSGTIQEDTEYSKLGVTDDGSEMYLLNDNKMENLHLLNA